MSAKHIDLDVQLTDDGNVHSVEMEFPDDCEPFVLASAALDLAHEAWKRARACDCDACRGLRVALTEIVAGAKAWHLTGKERLQ
jgi:hypothetical protein